MMEVQTSKKNTLRKLTGSPVMSSPTVSKGVVYVGSEDYNVYALNARTGAKLWSYPTGSWVNSSPAIADGVVYVGSFDKNVYALNAHTGRWPTQAALWLEWGCSGA